MTNGTKAILLIHEVMDPVTAMLEPTYETVKLWQYHDLASCLADHRDDIRVIATYGGLPMEHSILEALPNLGLIASVGAGYDGIDLAYARSRGIEVTYGAGTNADDVADFAVTLLLSTVSGIKEGEKRVREGRWTEVDRGPRRRSLKERRVGIVGLGAIGKAVAERLAPFHCPIDWYGPNPKPDVPWPRAANLMQLATNSDALLVTAPLNEATVNLIDGSIIRALGPQGILINVSRGGLVDEDALIAALRTGELGAAALDVYTEEPTSPLKWQGVENALLTPHLGGYATAAMSNLRQLLLENLRRFFAGERVLTPVP